MKLHGWLVLTAALVLGACEGKSNATPQSLTTASSKQNSEERVPLESVPANLRAAAVAAVPGLVPEKAEREVEKGVVVYDLEGKAGGVRYEVEVTADGKVLEVEKGDDDDHDDGDDDDDDDDKQ